MRALRAGDQRYGMSTGVEQLGGQAGTTPLKPAIIAALTYRPGARWQPRVRPRGVGALALLANAVPAKSRPAGTLAATAKAAMGTLVLEGERGDADVTAEHLMRLAQPTTQSG